MAGKRENKTRVVRLRFAIEDLRHAAGGRSSKNLVLTFI
jgi:hypothetical protein